MKARYFAVAVTVAMALALLTACGGNGSATHSTAPAANSAPARAPGEVEVDQIADFLAGLAKDPAKNFIMEQIGLPTTSSQLKALSNKIDALSNQLAQTETRLSTQIAELSLQGRVDYLQDQATNLRSFTNHYLKPLVSSIIKLKEAQEKHDQAAIDKAMADVKIHKKEFLNNANSIQLTTIAEKIHTRLQPLDGRGVLRQYGGLIMGKHRILNASDSNRLGALYLFLEEHQALATWMTVERAIAVGGTSIDTIKPTLDDFFKWQKQQRDPNDANGLFPAIPSGVAIDRGPDQPSPDRYSTVNKPMFMVMSGMYAYAPWEPPAWRPQPPPPTVQLAVQRANNAKFKGFGGWGVPSQGQVNDLFSPLRAPNRDSITAYIGNVFGNVPVPRPWIWDSDTTPQRYCHKKGRYIVCDRRTAWRGVSTDDLSNAVHPSYNGEVDLQAEYRGAQGGLILVRKTGDQDYL